MDALLTTEDVAEFFRVDVVTVRRMIGKGELPAYRIGGEYRLARTDLEEYLERQRLPARSEGRGHLGKLLRHGGKSVSVGTIQEALERFTKRAQSVLVLAQGEAQQLEHGYIGTEHLLLGVLREGEGMGATLLREAGCELNSVRQAVRDSVGEGPTTECVQGEMPLTPRLKRVLELARDEATRLDHAYIGTEHLVLGLLRDGEGVAGRLLREAGMELSATRIRVQAMLADHGER